MHDWDLLIVLDPRLPQKEIAWVRDNYVVEANEWLLERGFPIFYFEEWDTFRSQEIGKLMRSVGMRQAAVMAEWRDRMKDPTRMG